PIAGHGDNARVVHLQLRLACPTRSARADRGRARCSAADAPKGAVDAEIADGDLMPEHSTLEELARRAVAGDRDAVAGLVRALERDVYLFALRYLWHREDAEDATQEILVRMVTRL